MRLTSGREKRKNFSVSKTYREMMNNICKKRKWFADRRWNSGENGTTWAAAGCSKSYNHIANWHLIFTSTRQGLLTLALPYLVKWWWQANRLLWRMRMALEMNFMLLQRHLHSNGLGEWEMRRQKDIWHCRGFSSWRRFRGEMKMK